jgi:hypothetical protein
MTKKTVGLVLFWIAVIWAILWGVIASIFLGSALNNLTMEELNLTMWAFMGPWYLITTVRLTRASALTSLFVT